MDFSTLALLCAVGLLGPLLALPSRLRVPVVIGEVVAGVVIGTSVFGWLDPDDHTVEFLANIGFALIMFVAGTHVPVRDPALVTGIRTGLVRAVLVGLVASLLAWPIAMLGGSGHIALYAVLMASSSAAIIMPIVSGEKLSGRHIITLLPQITVADAVCTVTLPIVLDPGHAARALIGTAVVISCAAAVYVFLRYGLNDRARLRLHDTSRRRKFALELRIDLVILFSLAALAGVVHASVMLAGFSFGLAVAATGEPRRVGKQLFALTEGFFGPVYFIWLGATLDLRALIDHPRMIFLGVALGAGAVIAHAAMVLTGQPLPVAVLAAAQLGVPVSAATLGTQLDLMSPAEAPAILLGALVTLAMVSVVRPGRAAVRC
ncbi:cation:proton antiporter [Williamsia muralis]|uniref:cation:proton antiporter n=1 Tax=Williamsia marianensis TaxID=85044 RepID=UPI000DE6B896|nr:cation:proton antiporter [Williamsia marianensis]PVY33723.1 transporter (CPA2 family) [Williamsia marianensis]